MGDASKNARSYQNLPHRSEFGSNAQFIQRCIAILDDGRTFADPVGSVEMNDLQHRLFSAGRHDIALGRLFEGHVDAHQILHRYSDQKDLELHFCPSPSPSILGVWNAEGPDHHLENSEGVVYGGKSYASGAGVLTHAVVTTEAGTKDVQLYLIDLAKNPPQIDRNWWRVSGMQNSETHHVIWKTADPCSIGNAGDYEREPWFSCGALRFATVQAGGLTGLLDAVCEHLVNLDRHDDPVQQRRLAELHSLAQSAACVVKEAGRSGFDQSLNTQKAAVSNARNTVYAHCERGIALAQQACGTAAYFAATDVCRFAQDLGMYIRQPGPDAQWAKVGAAVASGDLDIWPCKN